MSREALDKRYAQGWIQQICETVPDTIAAVRAARADKLVLSIGYFGNIVDLWEGFAEHTKKTGENLAELASDQVCDLYAMIV